RMSWGDQSAGACDSPNTGNATGTCLDNHAATTVVCHASINAECDPAETCSADGTCPATRSASDTTSCTDTDTTDCHAAEFNGSGSCDQNGGFENTGYACGDQTSGACDS